MHKALDLSKQETWPKGIVAKLDSCLAILAAHEEDRRRVDKLCEEDFLARVDTPELCHSQEIALFVERINSRLNNWCLLGFHCTRFHEAEIEIIKEQGLKPLSENLAYGRVRRLQKIGSIPDQVASRLLSENSVNNKCGNRLGRLYFIFSTSTLKCEGAVFRLLSNWGGEALYSTHENDPEVALVLKSIGRPCIVQAAVPIAILNTYSSVGEKLVSVFLRTRGVATTDDGLLEGSLNQALPSDHIQRIIEYGEPEFEILTDCAKWRNRLTSVSLQNKCNRA